MDKLEQYLNQVCRSVGGPRSLRQHVRQELREHLLDAVAQHKAAGLPEEEALARALEDFGKPEDVRSELEATHGQRLLAVVIDKAMQWKEMTMRAKWLWTTWAYLGLVLVLTLEVLFLTFMVLFIVPKFQRLMRDGLLDSAVLEEQGATWMPEFLNGLQGVTRGYTTFVVLAVAVLWALFEWRVRSEHKAFIRLSALGTAAVGLMMVVFLTAGTMVVSFTLAMPALGKMARPFALEQVAAVDTSLHALEQARAKEDWKAMQEHASQANSAMNRLSAGPAVASLATRNELPTVDELRAQFKAAHEALRTAQETVAAKDAGGLDAALATFRKAFGPVREASRRPPR